MPDTLSVRVILLVPVIMLAVIMLAMRMMHLTRKMVSVFAVHSVHTFAGPG
jgi:hypothetical protein